MKTLVEVHTVFNRTAEVADAAIARAEALVTAVREEIVLDAKQHAPVGTAAEGDQHPGELRDSIHIKGEEVVADAPHADFVEHGTVNMPAQPFFAPACKRGKEKLDAGMARLIA